MSANNVNTGTCDCSIPQFGPITFNTIAFQNAADTIYEAKKDILAASKAGTLGNAANGQPIFKSDYERMQYLLGRQSRASCGVAKLTVAR